MWQLRRSQILDKALQFGNRSQVKLLSVTPCSQLHLPLPRQTPLTNASHRYLHVATSIQVSALSQSGSSNIRTYRSTNAMQQIESKDSQSPSGTSTPPAEGEDTVPVWQNPLHHNNPEMQKMFEDDFQEGENMVAAPIPPFESDPTKAVAPPHIHDLAHRIVNLTLLELKELTDRIAQHFDFDDQVMAASYMGGSTAASAASATQEEQQEKKVIFDLKLVGFDEKAKIKVIKEIRAIAGLGLKEAKELVEAAPKVFQKDLKQERAEELKAQLEAVGAQVEIV